MCMEQQICTAQEFGSALAYAILEDLSYPEHAHSCYELLYVLQGRVRVYTPGETCTAEPDQLVFLSGGVIHGYVSTPGSRVLMMGCEPEAGAAYAPILDSGSHAFCKLNLAGSSTLVPSLLEGLRQDPQAKQNRLALGGYVHFLLSAVACELERLPPRPRQEPDAFQRAITLLYDAAPGELDIETLAARAGISQFHLSRLFQKRLGMSFTTYRALIHTFAARRMLVQTALPVTEIAARCGYNTPRTFDRQFLALAGMTPRAYRRAGQDSQVVNYRLPTLEAGLRQRFGEP